MLLGITFDKLRLMTSTRTDCYDPSGTLHDLCFTCVCSVMLTGPAVVLVAVDTVARYRQKMRSYRLG